MAHDLVAYLMIAVCVLRNVHVDLQALLFKISANLDVLFLQDELSFEAHL